MNEDSVLQEVRAAREAFAESHGFNVQAMGAALRAMDDAGDWPVVRLAPRVPRASMAEMNPEPKEVAEIREVAGPFPAKSGNY